MIERQEGLTNLCTYFHPALVGIRIVTGCKLNAMSDWYDKFDIRPAKSLSRHIFIPCALEKAKEHEYSDTGIGFVHLRRGVVLKFQYTLGMS